MDYYLCFIEISVDIVCIMYYKYEAFYGLQNLFLDLDFWSSQYI